jgi:fused signal recognition particle receptor
MEKKSFYQKMSEKLIKTKNEFSYKINQLFDMHEIDEEFYEELEETLILSDINMDTAVLISEKLEKITRETGLKTKEEAYSALKDIIVEMTTKESYDIEKPAILLFVGVNGVGKTTTIAKLAQQYKENDNEILLVAGDTFRAAAVEQLTLWSQKIDVPIIKSKTGADPSSVIYDSINAAKARQAKIVLCDTAGRLHNKVNLMNELEKISRTIDKVKGDYNVYKLLVIDASNGQNALNQVEIFNEVVKLDGIVVTKLDGTSKGGMIISIVNQYNIPIRYLGIGEKAEDLIPFNPKEFIEMLFEKHN